MVLYGLYPYVLTELSKTIVDVVHSLHILHYGAGYQLACVMFANNRLTTHVWCVSSGTVGWKDELRAGLATVWACMETPAVPHSITYSGERDFASAIAGTMAESSPLVIPEIAVDSVVTPIQGQMLKGFHGEDPLGYLVYLQSRLCSARGSALMNKLPVLSKVTMNMYRLMICSF